MNGQKLVKCAYDAHIRILSGGFVTTALQNRRQPQSGHSANYLRVKGTSGESKSNETNIDHCGIQEGIVTAFKRGSHTHPKGISYYRIERRGRPDFEVGRTPSGIFWRARFEI